MPLHLLLLQQEERDNMPKAFVGRSWDLKLSLGKKEIPLQSTILQSMVNDKISQQRFCPCHENAYIKKISTTPPNYLVFNYLSWLNPDKS